MSSSQRVIKYLAVSFGIFLSVSIIFSIIGGLYQLTNILSNDKKEVISKDTSVLWYQDEEKIDSLDIDINSSNLDIKIGNRFMIETNTNNIEYKYNNGKLEVEEKGLHINKDKRIIIITIPNNIKLDEVNIDTGVGTLNIENINTRKLDIDLGAGTTIINNIYSDDTDIDTGAGTFTINNGIINNLDLDIGVGEVNITSNILGNSSISSGIGKLSLNILNTFDNYKFKVDKGIGKVMINNISVKDKELLGDGTNIIKLDGGIGDIEVVFNR